MDVKKIRVNAGGGYDITIGRGLLSRCGDILSAALAPRRTAVVSDSTVAGLYMDRVLKSLSAAGFEPFPIIFPAGEASKNLSTLSQILEAMAAGGLDRGGMAAALGGGVTGDLTGFAAGCYMRGVDFVQLPTTLLAAVDSSVGGKTGVDLSAGKNLAGLFLQPRAVICDINAMDTLTAEAFADGAAEAVKTGILAGEALFSLLESGSDRARLEDIAAGCAAFKALVVEEDEFENGRRKTLNLGHTAGHAIEKLSGYRVSHGHGVAMGAAIMARASFKLGLGLSAGDCGRIESALRANHLPVKTEFSPSELAFAALADKKRRGGSITLAVPAAIGSCRLETIPTDALADFFAAGMEG